ASPEPTVQAESEKSEATRAVAARETRWVTFDDIVLASFRARRHLLLSKRRTGRFDVDHQEFIVRRGATKAFIVVGFVGGAIAAARSCSDGGGKPSHSHANLASSGAPKATATSA